MGAFEVRMAYLEVDPSAVGRFEWRRYKRGYVVMFMLVRTWIGSHG